MSTTTIRLDDNLKKQLSKQLKATGLSINAYFTLAAKQLVIQKKVPFEILTEPDIPNETTRKAMLEAEAKAEGLILDNSPRFDNIDDLIESLDKED
ncbi:type II toxin-antitoxin system RelB/DinJ family antitoxin [Lactobacillus sp. LL6]|uniref:type II toxin-antitoxin system RelB/DinJ family antitoxin n=1 Tax=Lactobacillus sp. LL6 TaxID=2596827 RepID=UPI001186C4E3|nr:type II toxin-antitoxin system RelB/DinJ family antitoxin [Lactobacillus sp. LL6]TSO26130.1 type II toxin-antitoxin system RelB/DinJ family antitoxin [Lactobacillus sp. LL6]